MIRLTQLAVSKRSVTVLITIAMLLGGIFAWASLKQELLPDIAFPYVVVITPVPGASAQDVSTAVTEPIERSIGSLPALQHIDSSSVNSLSIVVASFDYGTDVKGTTATIDSNVKALGLTATSTVESFDINALPPLTVAIQAKPGTTTAQLDALAASTIVPALESVDGVSTVDLSGAAQERLMVELDPAKLAANNISIGQISGLLAANNLVLPAGSLPTTTASRDDDRHSGLGPASAAAQLPERHPLPGRWGQDPDGRLRLDGADGRSPWATWAPRSWSRSTPAATRS